MNSVHVVCRTCTFEGLYDGDLKARRSIATHLGYFPGHDVARAEADHV